MAAMNKTTIKALEKVFVAEIEGRLPFQSKAAIYRRLCDEGLIAPMERTFGRDRFGAITATGYELTHAGRFAYCSTCDDADQ